MLLQDRRIPLGAVQLDNGAAIGADILVRRAQFRPLTVGFADLRSRQP